MLVSLGMRLSFSGTAFISLFFSHNPHFLVEKNRFILFWLLLWLIYDIFYYINVSVCVCLEMHASREHFHFILASCCNRTHIHTLTNTFTTDTPQSHYFMTPQRTRMSVSAFYLFLVLCLSRSSFSSSTSIWANE